MTSMTLEINVIDDVANQIPKSVLFKRKEVIHPKHLTTGSEPENLATWYLPHTDKLQSTIKIFESMHAPILEECNLGVTQYFLN